MVKTVRKTTYKEALERLKGEKTKPVRKKPIPKKSVKRVRVRKIKSVKKKVVKKLRRKPKSAVVRRKPSRGGKTSRRPKKRITKKKPTKKRKIIRKKSVKRKKVIKRIRPKPKPKLKSKPRKKIIRKKVTKRKRVVKPRLRKKRVLGKKPVKRKRRKKPIKPRVYIGKGVLDQLFESQAKVKLLRFFFRNTEEMFQPREIFKRLRSNIALLRQEMKKLEKIGLIREKKVWLSFEKKRGGVRKEKKTVWCLNPNFDWFNELRDLVLKSTIASKDDLVEKAKKIGNIKLLVLTGVFTGDETAKADLLIVGDKINQRKLNTFIKDIEAEAGKQINCAVLTSKEFNYRYDMYDRFVRDLLDGNCEILIKKVELW